MLYLYLYFILELFYILWYLLFLILFNVMKFEEDDILILLTFLYIELEWPDKK